MCANKLRVVVAEGEPCEAVEALRAIYPDADDRFELSTVTTIGTVLPTLAMVKPDVVILHVNLAEGDPPEIVRRLHRASPQTPILVFAGPERTEEAQRCVNSGALNCLLKGHLQRQLLDRLFQSVLKYNTVDTLADLLRDPVTGLYLRDALLTLGTQIVERARQTTGKVVLFCGLVENWDALHKDLGPASADYALRDFAAVLCGTFRRTDFVARIGSEQFAVLAVDAAEPSAAILRQRLERRLAIFNSMRAESERVRFRGNAEFWDTTDVRSFSELLDSCESGLRKSAPIQPAPLLGPGHSAEWS
jgi:diguanylate cyclase (GGDEF)-like protein